jgi:hypothetical protein
LTLKQNLSSAIAQVEPLEARISVTQLVAESNFPLYTPREFQFRFINKWGIITFQK